MTYDPKTNRFPYPLSTDAHYLAVKKNDGTVFDRDYPYIDRSPAAMRKKAFTRFLLNTVVFPIARIRLGLRIEGRENLKKHRDTLKKGVISLSNHVHMWDYIALMRAVRPFRTNVLIWAPNIRGENGKMMRSVGGIPIPEGDIHALSAQMKALGELLEEGGWLQIYAEGSMWEYYAPIRPFKEGTSYLACKFGKPVLPMAFSYRKPGFLRRALGQIALFTVHIGEPLFPDQSLCREERVEDLTRRAHSAVCRLAGIDPDKNLYPAIFDNNTRVDYYTDVYGVGYKGSH